MKLVSVLCTSVLLLDKVYLKCSVFRSKGSVLVILILGCLMNLCCCAPDELGFHSYGVVIATVDCSFARCLMCVCVCAHYGPSTTALQLLKFLSKTVKTRRNHLNASVKASVP